MHEREIGADPLPRSRPDLSAPEWRIARVNAKLNAQSDLAEVTLGAQIGSLGARRRPRKAPASRGRTRRTWAPCGPLAALSAPGAAPASPRSSAAHLSRMFDALWSQARVVEPVADLLAGWRRTGQSPLRPDARAQGAGRWRKAAASLGAPGPGGPLPAPAARRARVDEGRPAGASPGPAVALEVGVGASAGAACGHGQAVLGCRGAGRVTAALRARSAVFRARR